MSARCLRRLPALLVLAAGSVQATPALATPVRDSTSHETWHAALRAAAVDPERGAEVSGLVLQRDVATFRFEAGSIHFLLPVAGRTWGAVFTGTGRLTATPPIPVERGSVGRFFEADSVDVPFTTAVLLFTDFTAAELAQTLPFAPMDPPAGVAREVEEAMKYLTDEDGWASRDVMVPFLNSGVGMFYAHVAEDRGDPVIFHVDPYDEEEVSISRRAKGKGTAREVVSRFHKHSDYANGSSLPQEALDLLRVDHYDVESVVDGNLDFSGRTIASVRRLQDHHDWVPFTLHSDLEVDSVTWADGSPVPFARPKKSSDLWVDLSSAPSEPSDLVFRYHGDILDRTRNLWVEMKTTTSWFPVAVFDRPTTYRLSFTTPKDYQVATVGRLVSEVPDGKNVTRVWETDPVRQITFNIGEFQIEEVPSGAGPHLTVQISKEAHNALNDLAFRAGRIMGEQRDMAQTVGGDLSNAFAFFNQAFGPTTVSDFTATEIPGGHGLAYPGLVLLSWSTFQQTDKRGYDEMFRAHEVAHQWWGIGVRPASYHDRWMAEGFSEFAGIWYMARTRGSVDLYKERLEDYREELVKRRDAAQPLWLGTRTGTSEHPEDYTNVVYGKGAWVLHMLRMLLTDFDGGSEDAFEGVMHDFYAGHLGKSATTEQFRAFVEARIGGGMGWFFDQWVYGSAIPTYKFSYDLQPQADGSCKASVRVRQEDVPDDFQMPVPILLDFGDAGTAVVRVLVKGPLTEAELPLLPMKPEKVEFNSYEAVLAETGTEKWKP